MAIHKKVFMGDPIDIHAEFICDSREDIANLPTQNSLEGACAPGSTAMVVGDTGNDISVWILNGKGKWIEI